MNTAKSASKRFCSVPQCATYAGTGFSLHYFPLKNQELCEKWKSALKIEKPITKYMNVCSKHFLKHDFMPATSETTRNRLKSGAIPSQNLLIRSHAKKESKEKSTKRTQWKLLPIDDETSRSPPQHPPGALAATDNIQEEKSENLPMVMELHEKLTKENNSVDVGTQTDFDDNFVVSEIILGDADKLKAFTDIDLQMFNSLKECCNIVLNANSACVVNLQTKLLLLLIKLKRNISFSHLGDLFDVSPATCISYFDEALSLLAAAIKPVIYWPSKREIFANMPTCFEDFQNTRIVLDCIELDIDDCNCLKCRIPTHSHCKGQQIIKFLIGVTPGVLISYISQAYGGRASDSDMFKQEKLMDKLDPLDAIMVDKGFLIDQECEEKLIPLIRPPFLKMNKQLSKADSDKTLLISEARIHVERVIQRIKSYHILNDRVTFHCLSVIDDILTVVAGLINLSPPILSDDKFIQDIVNPSISSRSVP